MKKTLLLSVVGSGILFAGGDIAPVEPSVVAPVAPVAESGWKFSGQGVFYYQTMKVDDVNFFDQDAASANAGIQLRAVNKDLIAGVGVGVSVPQAPIVIATNTITKIRTPTTTNFLLNDERSLDIISSLFYRLSNP